VVPSGTAGSTPAPRAVVVAFVVVVVVGVVVVVVFAVAVVVVVGVAVVFAVAVVVVVGVMKTYHPRPHARIPMAGRGHHARTSQRHISSAPKCSAGVTSTPAIPTAPRAGRGRSSSAEPQPQPVLVTPQVRVGRKGSRNDPAERTECDPYAGRYGLGPAPL
jgi:hypothetical protein